MWCRAPPSLLGKNTLLFPWRPQWEGCCHSRGVGSRGRTRVRGPWRSSPSTGQTLGRGGGVKLAPRHAALRWEKRRRAKGNPSVGRNRFSRWLFAFHPAAPWLGVRLSISLGWTEPGVSESGTPSDMSLLTSRQRQEVALFGSRY